LGDEACWCQIQNIHRKTGSEKVRECDMRNSKKRGIKKTLKARKLHSTDFLENSEQAFQVKRKINTGKYEIIRFHIVWQCI